VLSVRTADTDSEATWQGEIPTHRAMLLS